MATKKKTKGVFEKIGDAVRARRPSSTPGRRRSTRSAT